VISLLIFGVLIGNTQFVVVVRKENAIVANKYYTLIDWFPA